MNQTSNHTVKLKTNDAQKVLIFENWKHDTKSDGFMLDIYVSSEDFAAKQMFFIRRTFFEDFLRKLKKMETLLFGSVELREEYENHYVKMELDRLGHLTVIGEFWYLATLEQHLKFGFITDQTCLQPLHDDLSRMVDNLQGKT